MSNSPTKNLLLFATWAIRRIAWGGPCPCGGRRGEHTPDCRTAELFRTDEWAQQQAEDALDRQYRFQSTASPADPAPPQTPAAGGAAHAEQGDSD